MDDDSGPGGKATPPGYVNVAVSFARPPTEEGGAVKADRGAMYQARKAEATEFRDQLLTWLDDERLAGDVHRVGAPTAFNTLFVVASPQVVERLGECPGVVNVATTDGSGLERLK
jgi:hypothetical protein